MLTPYELVEKMAKMLMAYDTGIINGWIVSEKWEQELFKRRASEIIRTFLSEISKGEIVTTTEAIERGIRYNKVVLNQQFKEWMDKNG